MTGVAKGFNFCGDEDQTEERSCQGLTRWWVLAQFRHCTKWRGSSLTRRQKKRTKRVFIYMCRPNTKAEFFGENRLKADFIQHLTTVSPTLPSPTSMTIWATTSSSVASSILNTRAIWSALTKRWNLNYRWKSKILSSPHWCKSLSQLWQSSLLYCSETMFFTSDTQWASVTVWNLFSDINTKLQNFSLLCVPGGNIVIVRMRRHSDTWDTLKWSVMISPP